ncbi:sensor histidine kinase [Verminephrobacter eiseniae]|uniref:histidine kinase n=1 Tax=Verminephrobacter eiseniae (strain EF01-2) TaxID=391735 RepID=A1WI08_VEREI|nr:ATP-binding protein [Verminephrobacter eiseniae]ABM57265.1 histidine kinase [Verminephrobacter eiseniae EF01-2]MCW5282895.1 two-component sensor histidine kinase [Verminephrobacter eiseniae]MCW5303211.1 two-component sensor histidine kinase [Verminephrobacter eiseniae]MCW8178968.1 two-component sensor histidine kinase [Verminephrobacter eiseniae]MCW8189347.1 two-component sensor histidine kinase [Verminephrobacter eiseniae]
MTPAEEPHQQLDALRAALARSQQQLAEMAAAQEELLRAVAHDLRAPLRHVTAYGALVREQLGDLPPAVLQSATVQEALGFVGTMDQSARRMGLMIDTLRALLHARCAPLCVQPVALPQAVARACAGPMAAETGGRAIDWQVHADLPTLHADPALLQELLAQLLGNAIKFTRQSAQPRISVQALPAAVGHVAFAVQDNGVGFDPAQAGLLFGLFQRLHGESEFAGLGAGLALCRAIAQRHGGAITASAVPGGGCTVRVQWPAPAVKTQPPQSRRGAQE